jgi:hypothetical protein
MIFRRRGGGVNRPRFERRVAAICEGRVGPALTTAASRTARDGCSGRAVSDFCG